MFEQMSDPTGYGWLKSDGDEIADMCHGVYTHQAYDSGKANHDWGSSSNPGGTYYFDLPDEFNDFGQVGTAGKPTSIKSGWTSRCTAWMDPND